jgi:hypothetical protein
MTDLINPKEIEIEFEGEKYKFNISKLPATVAREVISKYPVSNMPKLGDYKVSEETMLKLISYTERVYDDRVQPLTSKALIDNHIPSWEILVKLEAYMLDYNCSFFDIGKVLNSLKELKALAKPKNIKTLMDSLVQLSQAAEQHLKNSNEITQ